MTYIGVVQSQKKPDSRGISSTGVLGDGVLARSCNTRCQGSSHHCPTPNEIATHRQQTNVRVDAAPKRAVVVTQSGKEQNTAFAVRALYKLYGTAGNQVYWCLAQVQCGANDRKLVCKLHPSTRPIPAKVWGSFLSQQRAFPEPEVERTALCVCDGHLNRPIEQAVNEEIMATAGAADVGRDAEEDHSGVTGVGDIRDRDDEDDTRYGFDSEDDGHEEGDEDNDDDVGDGAGLLLTVVSWVGGLLSSLEGLFASFGMCVSPK